MTEPTRTIAYTCPYVPAEWIAAHGFEPRRLIPLPTDGAAVAPRAEGLCPYARAFINDAAAENAAGIIVTTLCDQMRRAYDLLVRGIDTPVFLLNVPKTWQTVAARKMYLDELKRLGRFLVRLGGRAPTHDDLARAMIVGCAVHTISPTDEKDGVHGTPYIPIIGEKRGHSAFLFEEGPTGEKVECPHFVSVAVVGGPLMQRDHVLFDLIEESGGRVVLDATETGRRGSRRAFDRRQIAEDPLAELADAHFGIPDASRRPNSELYRWLKEELARTDARGIVYHQYIWCDAWRAELARLKEWVGLPVLGLDSDGHGETNMARLRTRIRAFVEMLQ